MRHINPKVFLWNLPKVEICVLTNNLGCTSKDCLYAFDLSILIFDPVYQTTLEGPKD